MPNLIDPRQQQHHRQSGDVECHQQGAARQAIGIGARQWRDKHIGHHLDRQRGPQHGAGILACQLVGQQAQGDGGQPSSYQSHYLREK